MRSTSVSKESRIDGRPIDRHIGAVHAGYEYFETEILFKGDPNLDPQSDSKLAIHLEEATVNDKTVLFGRFDMTLRPIGSD